MHLDTRDNMPKTIFSRGLVHLDNKLTKNNMLTNLQRTKNNMLTNLKRLNIYSVAAGLTGQGLTGQQKKYL